MPGQANNDGGATFSRTKTLLGVVVLAALVIGYWIAADSGTLMTLTDGNELRERILELGYIGPMAIIVLMTLAIVMSPIPSAPIALAAGAAYGHTWGTVYVLIGAETGALIAFGIARLLGYEFLRRWFGSRLTIGFLGSQNMLMAIVFVTRLLPFLSFDLVSYAAGLTSLKWWRFALATLAGIIPASFLLAHFGGEMASHDTERTAVAMAVLGLATFLSVMVNWWRTRRSRSHKMPRVVDET